MPYFPFWLLPVWSVWRPALLVCVAVERGSRLSSGNPQPFSLRKYVFFEKTDLSCKISSLHAKKFKRGAFTAIFLPSYTAVISTYWVFHRLTPKTVETRPATLLESLLKYPEIPPNPEMEAGISDSEPISDRLTANLPDSIRILRFNDVSILP